MERLHPTSNKCEGLLKSTNLTMKEMNTFLVTNNLQRLNQEETESTWDYFQKAQSISQNWLKRNSNFAVPLKKIKRSNLNSVRTFPLLPNCYILSYSWIFLLSTPHTLPWTLSSLSLLLLSHVHHLNLYGHTLFLVSFLFCSLFKISTTTTKRLLKLRNELG